MRMKFKYAVIEQLWNLTNKIGLLSENTPDDSRLEALYDTLSDTLDACEESGLIEDEDEGTGIDN